MRLQTRLVKLNSYKPENKTENPAKERDFLFYTIKTSHVTVTHPISQHDHLHLRLQKKSAILVVSQRRQPLTDGRTTVHILDKYLVYFKSGLY